MSSGLLAAALAEAARKDLSQRTGACAEREHAVGDHEDQRAPGAAEHDALAGEREGGGEVGALLAAAGVEGRGDALRGRPGRGRRARPRWSWWYRWSRERRRAAAGGVCGRS